MNEKKVLIVGGERLGSMVLEHLMRVKQLDIGDKTYTFKNEPELPAGKYELYRKGNDVEFVRVGDLPACQLDAEDQQLLNNLLERSEHN